MSDRPKNIPSRPRPIVRDCKIFGTEPANDERRITERDVGGFALLVLKNLGVLKSKADMDVEAKDQGYGDQGGGTKTGRGGVMSKSKRYEIDVDLEKISSIPIESFDVFLKEFCDFLMLVRALPQSIKPQGNKFRWTDDDLGEVHFTIKTK